jgi:hypothetical protein
VPSADDAVRATIKRRIAMANESDEGQAKREMRAMWAFSAGVVLLILGMMGANMLFHHPSEAEM